MCYNLCGTFPIFSEIFSYSGKGGVKMVEKAKRVTIRDIAERLGISPATVSTALTGRRNGVFVSEETRRRVWEMARKMGYPLERLRARAPQLQRVALFSTSYYWSMVFMSAIQQLSDELKNQGGRLSIHIEGDPQQELSAIRELYRRQEVDGFILLGSRTNLGELVAKNIPFVVVGEVPEGVRVWQVFVKGEEGGRLIGEHLWSLGHRKVGAFHLEYNPLPSLKRIKGLQATWQEHGSDFPDDWVLPLQTEDERELWEKLPTFLFDAKGNLRFTALFCFNDRVAGTAMKCLRRLGIKAPDDISLVGFDNESFSELLDPPLTTVAVPFEPLLSLAAQLLREQVTSPSQPPKQVFLPCQLIVRASTAPVRAKHLLAPSIAG